MTTAGFFSVIEWHDGGICVRARRRADLERLRKLVPELGEIHGWPEKGRKSDYRYRLFTDRETFERKMMPAVAETVTYGNFKSAAAKTTPDHERLYHRVWSILAELQPGGPFGWRETPRPKPKSKAKGKPKKQAPPLFDDGVCRECGEELGEGNGVSYAEGAYCRDIDSCLSRSAVESLRASTRSGAHHRT